MMATDLQEDSDLAKTIHHGNLEHALCTFPGWFAGIFNLTCFLKIGKNTKDFRS